MGVAVDFEGLTKAFGQQVVWEDVSFHLPDGEISVLLGPTGTGKSVFLKCLLGLFKPTSGHIWMEGHDLPRLSESKLYSLRRKMGVLFQDGALFGSMNVYDNVAFPLREHTRKSESEIRRIVSEKLEAVGLLGAERKLPGEISGGMRKRAGLARGIVLDPELVLFDEPDSGIDPVRTSYLNQLIVDLNQRSNATFLIVTHDINTARTLPDNIGLLCRGELVMFGHREKLLSSQDPAVRQFLNARMDGPIGMAEESDVADTGEQEGAPPEKLPPIEPQLMPSDGAPRQGMKAPGQWLAEHGIEPPEGSFIDDEGRDWRRLFAGDETYAGRGIAGDGAGGAYAGVAPGRHRYFG